MRGRQVAEALVAAMLLAAYARTFLVQPFRIPSSSMAPALVAGDQLLVNRFVYGPTRWAWERRVLPARPPRRGDVAVFRYPRDPRIPYVKRVLALPGETVTLRLVAGDVASAYRTLREAVAKAKGRVINAQLTEQDRNNAVAQLDFDLRRAEEGALQGALAQAGQGQQAAAAAQSITDPATQAYALARVAEALAEVGDSRSANRMVAVICEVGHWTIAALITCMAR